MRIVPAIVPTDYPGVSIVVHSPIDYYIRRLSAAKERETVQLIEEMKPGDVLYDVGANVGAYSLIAAKRHGGQVPIYAFEPGYANYAALCDNLKLNSASDVIHAFPVGLGDETGLARFYYSDVMTGASRHSLGQPLDHNHQPFSPVFGHTVLTWRLDDFIAQYRLPWPTHLKLDVDGTEFRILKGATRALKETRHLIAELSENDPEFPDIVQYLNSCGLSMAARHGSTFGQGFDPGVYNFQFAKQSVKSGATIHNR